MATTVFLDPAFPDHPLVVEAGGDAAWLFVQSICRSTSRGGRISKSEARDLAGRKATQAISALLNVGLWSDQGDSYLVDPTFWKSYTEPSATEVERRKMTPALRASVIEAWGPWCVACGWPHADEGAPDGTGLEIDHIVPVSKGGKTVFDNLTVLCRPCNQFKGTDDWDTFWFRHCERALRQ